MSSSNSGSYKNQKNSSSSTITGSYRSARAVDGSASGSKTSVRSGGRATRYPNRPERKGKRSEPPKAPEVKTYRQAREWPSACNRLPDMPLNAFVLLFKAVMATLGQTFPLYKLEHDKSLRCCHDGEHQTHEECGHHGCKKLHRVHVEAQPDPDWWNDHHERNIRGDNSYAKTAEGWMNASDDDVETGMDAMDLAYLTAHGAYTQFRVEWEYEKNPNGSFKKKGGKRVRIPGTREATFQIVIPYFEGEERKQRTAYDMTNALEIMGDLIEKGHFTYGKQGAFRGINVPQGKWKMFTSKMNVDPKTTSFGSEIHRARAIEKERFLSIPRNVRGTEYVGEALEEALARQYYTSRLLKQKKEGGRIVEPSMWHTFIRIRSAEEGGHDETFDRDESKRWKRCHHCLQAGDEPWHPKTKFGEHLRTCSHRLAKEDRKKASVSPAKSKTPKKKLAAAALFESSDEENDEPVETPKAKKQSTKAKAPTKSWASLTAPDATVEDLVRAQEDASKPKAIVLPTGPKLSRGKTQRELVPDQTSC